MSINRSSSGVRSLKAMFENQDQSSHDVRGRSPNGHLSSSANGDRPLSKVRSSFVAVEPSNNTPVADQIDPEKSKTENEKRNSSRESTASFRRQSFSLDESQDSLAIANLKKTISHESERRASNPFITETIPEAAIEQTPVETPAVEAKDYMAAGEIAESKRDGVVEGAGSKLKDMTIADDDNALAEASDEDKPVEAQQPQDLPAEHPDKPVSAAQEEPGQLKPSDPKETTTLSSAATPATPAKAATPAKPTKARRGTIDTESAQVPTPIRKHRPSVIATESAKPAHPSTPAAAPPKTPTSAKKQPTPKASPSTQRSGPSPKAPLRKPSRSSLAASTASSMAKSKPQGHDSPDKATKSKLAPATKPVKMSSHLTAPTASSAARKESSSTAPAHKPAPPSSRPAPATRTAPRPSTTSTKPTPRTSLARPPSAAAKKPEPRPARAPDESFLARMMRPTASSANKTHEKSEVKSPPRRRPSVVKSELKTKPKMAKLEKTQTNGTTANTHSAKQETEAVETAAAAAPAPATPADGASTPQTEPGAQNGDSKMEATPAFDAATIR